jgi:hypothetical protein
MEYEPPEPVTLEKVSLKVQDIEPNLRPPESLLLQKAYSPMVRTLPEGGKLVIRQAKREEAPIILKAVKPVIEIEKDFYDIVGARVYAEILAWQRYRIKDHYCLISAIDGELAAIANARLLDDKTAISLHTMTFKRGAGIGATMYIAKMEYTFDVLGAQEWWATYESYTGFRYWGVGLAQGQKPYPECQHELGGSKIFYTTREQWERFVKPKFTRFMGERPVPEDLLKKSEKLRPPAKIDV